MGQQFTDPVDSLLRCATMLWNHDSSLRVVWILFFSPYSSGTLFATPFSSVTLLFALCETCLRNNLFQRKSLCLYYLFSSSSFTTFPLHNIRHAIDKRCAAYAKCSPPPLGSKTILETSRLP